MTTRMWSTRPSHSVIAGLALAAITTFTMPGLAAVAAEPTAHIVASTSSTATALPSTATALPAGTLCEGPKADQPTTGPTKVILMEMENESSSAIIGSPDAPFENNTLSAQCGTFAATAMHSTTHPSEGNYFAEVSGLNPSINSGTDALARFGLSDCAPDSTSTSCTYGGGHFSSTVPSLFSQLEAKNGTGGWKSYSDDMPTACDKLGGDNVYVKTPSAWYYQYVAKHNPAVFFNGIACATQDVPSGDWQHGTGALYTDLMSGSLPPFTFIQPNDIENGHDPVSVNGVTVAGGVSQVGNIDSYLTKVLGMIQSSPDYQSGKLVVEITFDEGTKKGPIAGEDSVGENCADPNISVLATSCQVQTWIVGRYVPSVTYSTYMNQFGLLAATQRMLGLSPLLGHAGDASTPDIVNGTAASPNPFNLAANSEPPAPTVPGAPSGLTASAGNGSVGLTWSPPISTGGSPITDYRVEYRVAGSATWTPLDRAASVSATASVGSLVNGTSYEFRVSAVNAAGLGSASSSVTATPGAAVAAPELLPDPGFETGNGGWTPFSVGALTRIASPVHGGASALKVAATGSAVSLVGLSQNSVLPKAVAGTPYTASCWVQPTGANLSVLVRWLEYPAGGGASVRLGSTTIAKLATATWTRIAVTSTALAGGDKLIPQIYSTNETTGTGSIIYDDCSVSGGVGAPTTTVPGQPTGVTAVAGNGAASISFTAPASTGGAPITGYTVTASPGGATVSGTASPLTMVGLSNGTSYTFSVIATNAVGAGPVSAPSGSVTPAGFPGAPTGLSATPADGAVSLSWTAATANGWPVSGYVAQFSVSGTGVWTTSATVNGTTASVTGLTNGTSYDFQVSAINGIGQGSFSAIVAATPTAGTPPPPPPAPTELLPDPGFETGTGGWTPFSVGVFSRVASPVHGGTAALRIAATTSTANLVGMTNNSVAKVAASGATYLASCWVQATTSGLSLTARWLEYPVAGGSALHVGTTGVSKVPVGVWTLVSVSAPVTTGGDKMIPQFYSSNETASTGVILYDDCSVSTG